MLAEDKPKPYPSTNKEKREILLQRKKEIQNTMQKMSSELKVIEEQLRTLGEKELLESTNECENLKEDIDEKSRRLTLTCPNGCGFRVVHAIVS